MAGFSGLFGKDGAIEQLVVWQCIGQVISAMGQPGFTALLQKVQEQHPNVVLAPDVLARGVVAAFVTEAAARSDAAKSGIDADRFELLVKMAKVRISPGDLAEAVLRSYMPKDAADKEAQNQGVTPERLSILTLLAGDGIGPQQAAEALRRGIIKAEGRGPDSTSYRQAIAESRLHDKWGGVLFDLTRALLSPPAAAEAVVRGFLTGEAGAKVAALSGVPGDDFAIMVNLAGDAPSPTALAEALRRGIIPLDSGDPSIPGFMQGIQQGRLANKWAPMLQLLSMLWPTPTDALEARLTGQVTTAESQALYAKFGGDPQYFDLLFHTRGEGPTPLELGILANRGIIPWEGTGPDVTTFEQGVHETRFRNKWLDAYRALAVYRPPESTIVVMLEHGIITNEQAADMLSKLGMDNDTVAMYLSEAHFNEVSQYRGTTVDTVLTAYHEQLLTLDQATQILTDLHVDPLSAKIMVELQGIKRAFAAVNNVVSRIRTLYAARKITVGTVTDALTKLGIPADNIQGMVSAWSLENSISVKVLTEAQILKAWKLGILSDDETSTELQNIGYTPFDAYVLMQSEVKDAVLTRPPSGPAPPQGQVIPGTT